MTSFSSSSTAHPTGRLLCSACHLGIMGSRPLASVTRRVLVPPPPLQRTSTHSCPPAPNPRILSFTVLESTLPPRALVLPRSSAVDRRMGEGPDTHFSSCWRQGGSGLHSTTLEGPLSLGAPWCLREEPGGPPRAGRPSLLKCVRILPLAKAEGSAIHCPPPAPQLHVH